MKPNTQASASSRWLDCTASAIIDVSGLHEEVKPAADRGKFLHGIAHACLLKGRHPVKAGDLTDDEVGSIFAYVDYVRSRSGFKFYEVEGKFAGRRCFADSVIFDGDLLEVVDYKSGFVPVSAIENTQLIIYAEAVLEKFASILTGFISKVRLTIFQHGKADSWTITLPELARWRKVIDATLVQIADGEVQFRPSKENCHWCKAKPICPSLGMKGDSSKLDEGSWGERMKRIPHLESWIKGVRTEVFARLVNGKKVEGFKVVEGQRNRSWGNRKGAKKFLEGEGFGETDIFTDPVMVSPAVAEKLFKGKGSGDKKKKLGRFIERLRGGPTVVLESDKRPLFKREDQARQDFADHLGEEK